MEPGVVPRIKQQIIEFFEEHIQNRFPDPDYIFDVYVDRQFKVWLIDFNPFGMVTDGLMFSYIDFFPESPGAAETPPPVSTPGQINDFEFRVVSSPLAVAPSSVMMYRLPKDLMDVSNSSAIQRFFDNAESGSLDSRSEDNKLE
eukprot:TRINITY_DN2694_c0_g2_i8.p1 TRINITY_DN2694_c0_g2~~TRINITY_DN2694_c0_g2_i8.p1  ORF type:complete len:144 (-),score=11.35 TRINITY_DN2694_c0_g2_i8:93-524(-)